jgi:hypothetical protein
LIRFAILESCTRPATPLLLWKLYLTSFCFSVILPAAAVSGANLVMTIDDESEQNEMPEKLPLAIEFGQQKLCFNF